MISSQSRAPVPKALVVMLAALLVGLVSVRVPLARPESPPSAATRSLSVGDALKELNLVRPARLKLAEDFSVPVTAGKDFRLSDYRGKPVLINFWATWCAPCREEMPALERLYRQFKAKGFVLIAVSMDADPALVAPVVRAGGYTFPIGLDPKLNVANAYGVRGLPSSFLVDRQGHLAAFAIGPRAWDNGASRSLIEGMTR